MSCNLRGGSRGKVERLSSQLEQDSARSIKKVGHTLSLRGLGQRRVRCCPICWQISSLEGTSYLIRRPSSPLSQGNGSTQLKITAQTHFATSRSHYFLQQAHVILSCLTLRALAKLDLPGCGWVHSVKSSSDDGGDLQKRYLLSSGFYDAAHKKSLGMQIDVTD